MDVSGWKNVLEGNTFQIRQDLHEAYWLVVSHPRTTNSKIAVEITREEMEIIRQSKAPDDEAHRIDPGTHHFVNVRQ